MAKTKVKSKKTPKLSRVGKNTETPATHGQLEAVRSELKSDITTLSLKMDSKIQEVLTEVRSIKVLVEEQNSRNLFVMDSLRSVVDVQQDLMDRVQKLEKSAFGVEN